MYKDYTLPDYHNSAIVTTVSQVDMLVKAKREGKSSSKMIEKMTNLLNTYRTMRRPIIHAVKIYRPDGSDAELGLKEDIEDGKGRLIAGTPGVELIPELFDIPIFDNLVNGQLATVPEINREPLDQELLINGGVQSLTSREVIMNFPSWAVFFESRLDALIREFRLNTLIFIGFDFEHRIKPSIYQSANRNLNVIAVSDGIA